MNEKTNQLQLQSFESTEYIEIRVIMGVWGPFPQENFKLISPEMAF